MATSYFYEDDFLPYLKLFERYCPPPLAMPRGSLICKKGFSHDWLYYLNSGMVKVYSNNYHGYERIVAYLNKNSIFGLDCLNPGSTSIVTIECITDVWLMPFKRETLHAMMAESLDFSYALVAYYCKVMRQLCFDAENQSISDTATRLANFLYLCVSHRDEAQPRVDLTQQDVASAINCSRTSVSRLYGKWKEQGIIRIEGKGICILDPAALQRQCRF